MHSTQAIAIRLTRLTDTSLIVHWFSREYGLVKTVAKGARRPKSPFAGKLDLFFGGEITFLPTKHGELHPLREVAISDWREGLRKNYTTTLLAGYCCQLLESAVEPQHSEPDLYDLLRRALDHLASEPPSMRALLHFERELARMLGIGHANQSPDASLRDAIGRLPTSRNELCDRLNA